MSRGVVITLCAALGAACVPEPTFKGVVRDADGDGDSGDASTSCGNDVTVTRTGLMDRGATVCGPGYEVRFSDLGAKMPSQLNVGGTMLVGTGQSCNDERGMGVAIYPAALVNGEEQAPAAVDGTLSIAMTGPVIGRVVVNWSASYACTGSGTLEDATTFTFFPDGHITRFDRLRQDQQVSAAGCGVCGGGGSSSELYLTSYTTLLASSDAVLTGAAIDLTTYGQEVAALRSPCLTTFGKHVAFGFRNGATRVRVAGTAPRALAFVQDVSVGQMLGPSFVDEVTTHMLVSSTTECADLAPRALALADRPGLQIQGTNAGPALDGIYGGENDGGNTAIQTTVGDIPIQLFDPLRPVPGGFAVWVDFGAQPNTNVMVMHNGVPSTPSGEWYRIQRVSPTQLIFWFRDELVANTIITLHPN